MSDSQSGKRATRSRLDDEPKSRRDILGLGAVWTAGAALLVAFVGLLRLPKPAVWPRPSRRFTIRPPATQEPGQPYIPSGRNLAFYRDKDGAYAISLVCTHLGCIVKPGQDGFLCPCHGSVFDPRGAVVSGPAPKSLSWYQVQALDDGSYLIDEEQPVTAGFRAPAHPDATVAPEHPSEPGAPAAPTSPTEDDTSGEPT